ncbi:pectate lyase-like protein [Novosphingobium kunmingense]|uniref:Pectate lyase-like protein n=1 Tax=Novosphingobium kunmingense TaxID=1211806 RepID=A0A2N0HK88_9SPHN|nr:glycosyl hydrolase family 28-related protein [Novosphingobium kunmingense]PKB19295.1 pectate lyase-like protein [Novosphingobium kunmingense]
MSADIVARGLAKQAASTSTGRTVQDKLSETVSVLDFGAKGDGVADDTAAIQAAINAELTPNGGALYFPDGIYRITAKLVIPFATGWRIYGQSRRGTIIRQATSNTRIFSLESDLIHSWEIGHLSFQWAVNQPASNTQAVAIFLGTGAATSSGLFDWHVHHCVFHNGFRGVASDPSNSPAVWGATVDHCQHQGTMSGAMVCFVPTPAVGQPRITVADSTLTLTNASEAGVRIYYGDNIVLRSLELLGGTAPIPVIEISGAFVSLIGCKVENYSAGASSTDPLIKLVQSQATVINCSCNGLSGSGGAPRFIQGVTGTQLAITGLWCSDSMTGGTPIAYCADTISLVANVRLQGRFTDKLRSYIGSGAPLPRLDIDKRQSDAVTEIGDASVTLNAASDRIQCFTATVTAARSVTLPGSGVAYDGMEFEVVRRASSPGAFVVQVIDPLSGQDFFFPANCRGSIRYRCIGGGSWRIMQASTFHAADTGWTASTGTASKAAFAVYAGATHTASYVQATVQALDNAARDTARRVKAIEDALFAGGLIRA